MASKTSDKQASVYFLLMLGGMLAVILAAVGVSEPVFDELAPWLDERSGWERAGWGLVGGALLAAPVMIYLSARVRRILGWPVGFWLATSWVLVCIMWLPPKQSHGPGVEEALYRSQVDWFIPTSILAFHAVLLGVGVWALRRDESSADAGKKEKKQVRESRSVEELRAGLRKVKPQRVEHEEGWSVASVGREQVKYVEEGRSVLVDVDRGRGSVRIYTSELSWSDGPREGLSATERERVLVRVEAGLLAMGYRDVELFPG